MIKVIEGNLMDCNADVIAHQCNCMGVMGKGVALCVKAKYPNAYNSYRKDFENGRLNLGYVGFVGIGKNRYVANICGQYDYYRYVNPKTIYTDYKALGIGFRTIRSFMTSRGLKTLAMPYKIGCGLAGGDWNIVYKMIEDNFKDFNVELWKI